LTPQDAKLQSAFDEVASDISAGPSPPAPPLLALLESMPDLVLADILARLDPADFAVLAQVGCRGIILMVYRCSPRHPPLLDVVFRCSRGVPVLTAPATNDSVPVLTTSSST
jgi:hypothetical protein